MDPLRAARRVNPPAGRAASSASSGLPCPRCQEPLWDIAEGRWCSACGYRQTGGKGRVPPPGAVERRAPRRKAGEWTQVPRLVPRWAWVMLGGVAAVGLGSADAGLLLPPASWQRAVWTTGQIVVGLVGLLLAQVAVCSWLGEQQNGPSLWDLLMPDRIWRVAIGRLPETRWAVCCAAWCVTLIVCALVFVGGLTYWLPKKGEVRPTVHVAKLLDVKHEETEPEKAPAEGPAPRPGPAPAPRSEERAPATRRETARCVVVGYTVENDEVTSLVVARVEGEELRYAGTVRPTLTPEQRDDLLKRFGRLASSRPVFRDFEKPVVWLKPELACEVEHAGAAEGSLLKEPRFKGLVEDEKPGAAPGKKPTSRAPRGTRPGRTTAGATRNRP